MSLSHFYEKSGIIAVKTSWGRWWQTVNEIFIEVDVPPGTPGKECSIKIESKHIDCRVKDKCYFKGALYKPIRAQESTWSLEERKTILILLEKVEKYENENIWPSLLEKEYSADPFTQHEMLKKLDLEKFQMENPGFNFSGAELSKTYNNPPFLDQKENE